MKAMAQVFLSYAREDEEKVKNLHQKLSRLGFKPWMDKNDILPGEKWKSSIQKAIQCSDFFLVCLSANSFSKRGFLQKEIKDALDIWQEMLDSDIYLIPVRLEDCEVPENLRDFQWVNLFEEDGWIRLVKAIQVGMERRAKVSASELPGLERIFSQIQQLEERYQTQPENADNRMQLGKHLFLLGNSESALEHFLAAAKLKPDPRGIGKGWIILASLTLGDTKTVKQILNEGDFQYRDWDYYKLIYESWCSALDGSSNAWEALISRCLEGKKFPPLDIHSPPYVYLELAAGLAATDQINQAWKAIDLSEVYRLPPLDGELYMCGLASMPTFDKLHEDSKYRAILEDWFDSHINHLKLYPLKELRAKIAEWHNRR